MPLVLFSHLHKLDFVRSTSQKGACFYYVNNRFNF